MNRLVICAILTCTGLAAAPTLQLDELPKVLRQRAPTIPSAFASDPATVEVFVEINEAGHVINAAIKSATDPRLAVPCLRAIRKWRYEPAKENGAPVAACFVQPFRFGQPTPEPAALASAPPRAHHRVTPRIPAGLEDQEAEVTLAINLSAQGTIEDVQVVESTHAQLEDATVDAALKWTFTPAIEDGFPVPSRVRVPFHYLGNSREAAKTGPIVQVAKRTHSRSQ